ncbi:MAG: hypothetical protein ACRDHN_15315, partial [Thermomicrobiales bacterium]
RDFIDRTTEVTRRLLAEAYGPVRLDEAIAFADPLLGPFGFARDLQFALVAHLDDEVLHGHAERVFADGIVTWQRRGGAG